MALISPHVIHLLLTTGKRWIKSDPLFRKVSVYIDPPSKQKTSSKAQNDIIASLFNEPEQRNPPPKALPQLTITGEIDGPDLFKCQNYVLACKDLEPFNVKKEKDQEPLTMTTFSKNQQFKESYSLPFPALTPRTNLPQSYMPKPTGLSKMYYLREREGKGSTDCFTA